MGLAQMVQTGDIIHVQSQTVLARLIRWFSTKWGEKNDAWPTHTAMVLDTSSEPVIIEALSKVVVRALGSMRAEAQPCCWPKPLKLTARSRHASN